MKLESVGAGQWVATTNTLRTSWGEITRKRYEQNDYARMYETTNTSYFFNLIESSGSFDQVDSPFYRTPRSNGIITK